MYKLPVDYDSLTKKERYEVRLQYIEQQNNKCLYCNSSLDEQPPKEIFDKEIDKRHFPKGFFNYPVHLQHNHSTGLTEGAVHAYCNAVMWEYEDRW